MTDFVLDTMALVKHLEDDLPAAADRAFREAESGNGRMFLPEIALGEFICVALRGRVRVPNPRAAVDEVVDHIRAAGHITLSSLPAAAWSLFLGLRVPELHDRMIAADALFRGLPLITNDPTLRSVPRLRTLWR